jgi:hypothetical protein
MNEAEVRVWFKEIGTVVLKGTTITQTPVDDQVVAMFFNALENDFVWQFLWPIIDGLFVDADKVMATEDFSDACTAKAINPLVILSIVKTIIDLWNLWKKGQA